MLRRLAPPISLCLLVAGAAAQTRVVPDAFANAEANGASAWPFSAATFRLQQLHGDLRGQTANFTSLALRRDGLSESLLGLPRAVTTEIAMARTSLAAADVAFAANRTGAATIVFDRKSVALPDRVAMPTSVPAPFDVTFTFDRPYSYDGLTDVLFDVSVFTSSALPGEHWFSDAVVPGASLPGISRANGRGCQTDPFNPLQIQTLGGVARVDVASALTLSWSTFDGPSASPAAVFFVGTSDPDLPVPGLCSRLRSDLALSIAPERPVSSLGVFRTPDLVLPWNASFAGVTLFAQSVAIDSRQTGLPIAVSNGLATTLPPGPPQPLAVKMVVGANPTAPAGFGVFDGGLVVRFGL